ncbi:serine/threonine-protein kinase PknK [Polyangium fumosum]|uniref:Serine/threonine-protein kinase PknK n=1 Tax=Polyangium fumosum TaxID=889272 RepID=A0A4U1J133_9BACT|nr:serine/threonine-protein kinase [Polyangium fumosum]TKD00652.1 serine/threonine-protein kinase PknK [Polyangium fumosum]
MLKPGMRVAARFELDDHTIAGGMATIYRARDLETGAVVAVKVLGGRNVREMERFSAEAVLLAELRHPGIVRYVSHGSLPAGELFLVMEWLEGEDLSDRLARGRLPLDEAIRLARRVADALGAAHARGIVHRDVKPSNVFLPRGDVDEAKLLDFGIARLGYGRTLATRTGTLLGTPGYMAPEQAQGRKDVDARADVFSLGAMLFECLTGRPAFASEQLMATLSRILFEEPPRVRTIRSETPAALDLLVTSMLCKDPAGRPRDGSMIVAAVDALGPLPGGPSSSEFVHSSVVSRPAITVREQQLLCVVLATSTFSKTIADGDSPETDVTLTPGMMAEAILRRSLPSFGGDAVSGTAGTLDDLNGAAAAYGGKLEQLVDGSLLAVFTGAAAAIDLAARAARAAIALRELLPGVPIAVATGRGLVAQQLPVGEAAESAARTLSAARREGVQMEGRVFVDEVTAGLLDARFDVREEGVTRVLEAVRDRADAARTLLGKPSPCVGREREIGTLVAIMEESIAEPIARVSLVTGPAGVGKSRVATEVLRRLDAAGHDLEVWVARGDPMAAGSTFNMLAQIIRAAAGIEVGALASVQEEKLLARVASCVAADDVVRVTVFLGEILGLRLPAERSHLLAAARADAMLMGDQMRRAFEDWLFAECTKTPVLLLLDDLHFGDLSTVRLIDAALRHAREKPLCVLALARTEISRVFPRLWEERGMQEVRLGELGRRASEQLCKVWLGSTATPDLTARIIERAAGNPFYLEEIVRAVASGRGDALPGTVLAMVQARLEELEAVERRILRAASVFGDVFWPAGAAALVGGEKKEASVREALGTLVERELVVRRTSRRFLDQEDHAFRNALVREAAYATLTDADRMLGHRLAAAWLESVGETEAMVLAQHHERGGDLIRAASWYARAAETALEGSDFEAVIERSERAITCGAQGEELGRLRLRQAEAYRWQGKFSEAEERGLEAIQILPAGSDPWLFAVGEMASVFGKLGSVERVEVLGDALLTVACMQEAPASDGHIAALSRTSTAALLLGKNELAESLFKELERLGGASEKPLAVGWRERARAFRAPFVGETGASARFFALSAEGFEKAGDVRNACLQRANYGASCLEVGDWIGAEKALVPAIVDAERMGAKHIVSSAQRDLGYAFARMGRLDEAKTLEEQAVAEFSAHGDRRLEGVGRDELATIHLMRGDVAEAEAEARRAVDRLAVAPPYLCHGHATLARVLLVVGNVEEALVNARASRKLLTEVGALEEGEGLVRLILARALHAAGEVEEARVVLVEALQEIDRRTATIADPDARQTFAAIPEHVETREIAQTWGITG